MSPSPACAPRRRGAPDAFGAAKLLYEKTAGRSCRRCARTTYHSTTGAHALQRAPSDKGAPSDARPACPRPILRPQRPLPPKGRGWRGVRFPAGSHRRPSDPLANRKAGLDENGLAPRLDDPSRRDRARLALATDAGRAALGRASPARELADFLHHPCRAERHRSCGPTLPRTGQSVTRIDPCNNRLDDARPQISVHGLASDPQFVGRLSTELPTGTASR